MDGQREELMQDAGGESPPAEAMARARSALRLSADEIIDLVKEANRRRAG